MTRDNHRSGPYVHKRNRRRQENLGAATFDWVAGESVPLKDPNYNIPDEIGQKRFSMDGVVDRFRSWVRRLTHKEQEAHQGIEGRVNRERQH